MMFIRLLLAALYTAALADASSKRKSPSIPKMKPAHWPHQTVFVTAGDGMRVLGREVHRPLPLGVPFEIDSPLFSGRVLLRFRNIVSDDPAGHSRYFQGQKRLMQTVVQGRFKRKIKMSDLYVGSVFSKALAAAPPPAMSKIMEAVIRRIAPGLIFDLSSDQPKIVALLAGTAQTMSIDRPGNEPDIASPDIEENVAHILGAGLSTEKKRKKVMGSPKKAASYEFDTDHVYTFHTYDEAMDYGRGTMHLPMYGEYDIKPMIGNQPLSLTGTTQGGDVMYDMNIWHENNVQ